MKKFLISLVCLFICCNAFAQELRDAPDFSLRKVAFGDNSPVSLNSYKNRIVLLVFFARWDATSVNQIPIIETISEEYQEVSALGINASLDADNNLTRFHNQMQASFPFLASDGVVTRQYGVGQALPVVCIITPDQKIYKKYTRLVSTKTLRNDLDALIEDELKKKEEEKRKKELQKEAA